MATDWQNFQDWLNSGQGWIFYFALFLAFLVILLFVALRSVRAPGSPHRGEASPSSELLLYLSGQLTSLKAPGPQHDIETSPDQEQGESEQK
jgi:hypothetical protein